MTEQLSTLDALADTREWPCADCKAAIQQQGVSLMGRDAMIWNPWRCDSCQAKRDKRDQGRQSEKATVDTEARAARALEMLSPPPLYRGVSFDTFTEHGSAADRAVQRRVKATVAGYVEAFPRVEPLLVFAGGPGTGKGHLVWSAALALAGQAVQARVVKLADLIRELRGSWRDADAASEDRVLAKYRQPELLVIDEVSRHAFYGQQIHQHLYDVIDHRVEHRKPTILTTNEDDAGVIDILRAPLVDRVQGNGGWLDFGTASWRARPREVA